MGWKKIEDVPSDQGHLSDLHSSERSSCVDVSGSSEPNEGYSHFPLPTKALILGAGKSVAAGSSAESSGVTSSLQSSETSGSADGADATADGVATAEDVDITEEVTGIEEVAETLVEVATASGDIVTAFGDTKIWRISLRVGRLNVGTGAAEAIRLEARTTATRDLSCMAAVGV